MRCNVLALDSQRRRFAATGFAAPADLPRLFLVRERAAETYDANGSGGRAGVGHARTAVPDPFDDADALDELGDEIATLAAHIHAATHRMLSLIAEFDRRRGWEIGGHGSCAHWLAVRTGIDLGAAREKVRTARALADLPATSASMARGELSFSQVRALTRVARPDTEADLLELARGCTTAVLERVVRAWRRGSRADEAALERERHERRCLSVFPDEDGMYVVKGRLEPEVAAVLMRAVDAASDALFREAHVPGLVPEEDARRAAAQRRADAVGLLAERALAAGFRGEDDAPISGSRAARYQVMLHVDEVSLAAEELPRDDGDGAGDRGSGAHGSGDRGRGDHDAPAGPGPRCHLEDGTRVSAETSRRLACDAALVRIRHAAEGPAEGAVVDAGRRTRTISPALRRALEARDSGCRFPGCNATRFTDAHHVNHWADGGETSLANTVLLCRHHHRLVHEGEWRILWWGAGRPVFIDPRGGEHYDARRAVPELGSAPVEALVERHRLRDVRPDGWTAGARWKREADIPDRVYFRALEAAEG